MAYSKRVTHRLLNAWCDENFRNIWHFNSAAGLGDQAPFAVRSGDMVYVQQEREYIAKGIVDALSVGVNFLGTFHRPVYVSQTIPFTSGWPGSYGARVKARYHHIQAIGKRGVTVIQAAAAVAYSDQSGSGTNDTATVTVTLPGGMTITDVSEIQVFFKNTDSLATDQANERWEIEPLQVVLSGSNVTITGHRALFVKPSVWRTPYLPPNWTEKHIANTGLSTDFVTQVDVFRVYPDATGAVTYNTKPSPNCGDCAYGSGEGSAFIANSDLGYIQVCSDCASFPCSGYPESVTVYYQAGYPLDPITGEPDSAIQNAFCRLANAKMPAQIADFADPGGNIWIHDYNLYPAGELPPELASNPFGVRRGEVESYRVLSQYVIPKAGASLGSALIGGGVVVSKQRFKTLEAAVKGLTDAAKKQVDAAYLKVANEIRAELRKVVQSWASDVDFAVLPTRYKDAYLYQLAAIGKDAIIFTYVDKGTEPHEIRPKKPGGVLAFRGGYSAKTRPIAVYNAGSGKASGDLQFAQVVHHPGTEARQFTKTILDKMLPKIQQYARENLA